VSELIEPDLNKALGLKVLPSLFLRELYVLKLGLFSIPMFSWAVELYIQKN